MRTPLLALLGGFVVVRLAFAAEPDSVPATPSELPPPPGLVYEVRTADGEVFRGELIQADATRVILRSRAAGEIIFSAADIAWAPLPVQIEPPAPAPAWVAVEPAPPPATPATPEPAPEITEAAAPAKPPGRWTRVIEAGYNVQSSTVTKRDTYLRAEAAYRADHYLYRGLVKYLYGEQSGEKNTDRLEGLLAFRHDLARRWLFRADVNYRNDHLRDLDLETSGLAGVQYVLFAHPRFRLSLGPGAGFRYRETDAGLLQGTRFNTDFVEEAAWTVTDRITFTQGAAILCDTAEPEAYRTLFNAAFSAKLTDHVRANLRYEHEQDRARPAGPSRVDQRLFTTLGLEF